MPRVITTLRTLHCINNWTISISITDAERMSPRSTIQRSIRPTSPPSTSMMPTATFVASWSVGP